MLTEIPVSLFKIILKQDAQGAPSGICLFDYDDLMHEACINSGFIINVLWLQHKLMMLTINKLAGFQLHHSLFQMHVFAQPF